MKPWETPADISTDGFMEVFENRRSHLIVPDFLTPSQCSELVENLLKLGIKKYDYEFDESLAPPAQHLFTTHYLFENKTPEEYLPVAAESIQQYLLLCKLAKVNPVLKLINLLEEYLANPISIAEENGEPYSYVIARVLNHSVLLHADYAHFLPSYWSISKVIAQFAWNVYLTDPGEGGETIVYNKPWEKADDQFMVENTYGYDPKLVAGKPLIKFKPNPGTLMIFNSRNFHEVLKCTKQRFTLGGHIGLTDDGRILLWV